MRERHTAAELLVLCTAPTESGYFLRSLKLAWRQEFGPLCQSCGTRMDFRARDLRDTKRATVDHIMARSAGGTNELKNLQVICVRCNNEKSRVEGMLAQARRETCA